MNIIKAKVKSSFTMGGINYEAGQVCDFTLDQTQRLKHLLDVNIATEPGPVEQEINESPISEQPPVDKMIKRGRGRPFKIKTSEGINQ